MSAMEYAGLVYPSFDLTPLERPLSDGGRWGSYSTRQPLMVGESGHAVHGTQEWFVNGSVYIEQAFHGPIVAAWGCRPESAIGAALESHRIVALYGDVDAYNGYSSGFGGGIGEFYFFRRYDNFDFTDLGTVDDAVAGGRPERLGIRITPTHVQQWAYFGGAWHLIQEFADDTHRGPVHFALETEEQGGTAEVAWSCFAAGVENDPEFLLWMPSAAPEA